MLEFLEKTYSNELDRKDKLTAAAPFPIGLGVVCIGLLNFCLDKGFEFECSQIAAAGFFIISSLFLAGLGINVVRFYYGHEYSYTGTGLELLDWRQSLIDHSNQFPSSAPWMETFNEGLERSLARSTHRNHLNNNLKSNALHWMHITVFSALLFALSCATAVVVKSEDDQKIEVIFHG